jgi:hypothetical protein
MRFNNIIIDTFTGSKFKPCSRKEIKKNWLNKFVKFNYMHAYDMGKLTRTDMSL